MKLVRKRDYDCSGLIVSESILYMGIYMGSSSDVAFDKENYELAKKYYEDENLQEKYRTFFEFLEEYVTYYETNIEFEFVMDECYATEEEVIDRYKNKYIWNSFTEEFQSVEDYVLGFETLNYLEYWDGSNIRYVDLEDCIEDLELIEKDLEGWKPHKTSQYDLYRSKEDDTLWLGFNSYYQGCLTVPEMIDKEELEERFGYIIEQQGYSK